MRSVDRGMCRLGIEPRNQAVPGADIVNYCTKTRKGKFKIGRKAICKRLSTKLREVKAELRKRMHSSITAQGKWLKSVVQGYYNYHAVPGNWEAIGTFRTQVARIWYKILRRRSQRTRINWGRMNRITTRWLPPARILYPYPESRFYAKHPR
jgi:RNA-directed DNA polymerase